MLNLDYHDLKNRAINLKSIKAKAGNYFTLSDVTEEYEKLVDELLELLNLQLTVNTTKNV